MARPRRTIRSTEKLKGVYARLDSKQMAAFEQIALSQRRALSNLASLVIEKYIEAEMASKPINGHEYKAPRIRAPQTI